MNSYEKTTQEVRDAFAALCKGRVEAAVLAEREACAKVCEDLSLSQNSEWEVGTLDCADAIRARGNT
jgi:ketosteroid isomerase-like protein